MVSITRQHEPCWRASVSTDVDDPSTRLVETRAETIHPSTRAVETGPKTKLHVNNMHYSIFLWSPVSAIIDHQAATQMIKCTGCSNTEMQLPQYAVWCCVYCTLLVKNQFQVIILYIINTSSSRPLSSGSSSYLLSSPLSSPSHYHCHTMTFL